MPRTASSAFRPSCWTRAVSSSGAPTGSGCRASGSRTSRGRLHTREVSMAWLIERCADHVALVTMDTNKANAQNPAFFQDLHRAFDRLER